MHERRVWDLHPCLRLEGPLSWLLDERALWRRPDSHRQPPGYEPGELLLLHSATLPTGVAPVAFRSTGGRSAIRDLRELMLGPDGVAPSPSGFRPVALLIELRTREQASCQEAFVASLYDRGPESCHRRHNFRPRLQELVEQEPSARARARGACARDDEPCTRDDEACRVDHEPCTLDHEPCRLDDEARRRAHEPRTRVHRA